MFSYILHNITLRNFIYFFSLIAGWPCVFYLMGWLPHYTTNYVALLLVSAIFVLFNKAFKIPQSIYLLVMSQVLVWAIYSAIHVDSSYLTRIFMLITTLLILGIQNSSDNITGFLKNYNIWLTIQVVMGALGFLLVLVGILHPISRFIEMDGRPGYFFGLFTTNTFENGLIRNAGFYDEPGALAFWGMNALIANKLFFNNKKIEWLLIIGLISTLSMAYFIQLGIYVYLFYKNQRKKVLLPLVMFFLILKGIATQNEVLNHAIFGRFEYNAEDGTLQGDNRTELMARCWKIFLTAPIIGVGATNLATNVSDEVGFVGANFFMNWASDGIIGVIVTYLPLLFLFYLGRIHQEYKYACIILTAGFLQRPYTDTQLLYPLFLFSLILLAYHHVINGNIDESINDDVVNLYQSE